MPNGYEVQIRYQNQRRRFEQKRKMTGKEGKEPSNQGEKLTWDSA